MKEGNEKRKNEKRKTHITKCNSVGIMVAFKMDGGFSCFRTVIKLHIFSCIWKTYT